MKTASIFLLIAFCAAAAQSPPAAKPSSRAAIDGIVSKDPGSEPVKKALIELIAENQSEGGDYTAVTAADGTFHIDGILPGRYHLFAERTGFLEVDKHHSRSAGHVLTLAAGQEVKDLSIRLQAAAVVRGRVTDEDGEPMPNAQVAVLKQTYAAGRSRWEQAGSERTNDLGEYRIANLAAGNYFVSVSPPPDFKSLIETASAAADPRPSPDKTPPTAYQTTYYPGTADRGQAAPIQLHAGDDFPANFSLTPSPSLSIRGSVVNLPPRTSPSLMVKARDFTLVQGTDLRPDGSFTLRDVSPGAYTIIATATDIPVPMMARQTLQVAGSSIEGVRLILQPGAWIHGRLRFESRLGSQGGAAFDHGQIFLTLHAADGDDDDDGVRSFSFNDASSDLAQVAPDGSFEFKSVPPGTYYVKVGADNGGDSDWFLKSTVAGGRDVSDAGITVEGGTVVLDLVASANGGVVDGVISDKKNSPVSNAVIVAVPEAPLRTREDRYRKTVSDQNGHFTLRGIPPGDYTLFAWESVDGEAYLNSEFLKSYEAQGIALHVGEGERKSLQVPVIPEAEEQP
jgi:protocatechuate 3,4-dioxygenase beta subunit